MNQPRETIAVAFFGLFSGLQVASPGPPTSSQPFTTVTRVYELPQNIPSELLPALYVVEGWEDTDGQRTTGLETYNIRNELWIVAPAPADGNLSNIAPGTILNPLIDAVDLAFKANALLGVQTLGGLVMNCYLNGPLVMTGKYLPGNQGKLGCRAPVTIRTGQ